MVHIHMVKLIHLKKIVAWPTTWILFGIGHLISKLMDLIYFDPIYSAYNATMGASIAVQDWARLKSPWKKYKKR